MDDDNEDAVNVVLFVLLLTWFLWRDFGVDYDGCVGFFPDLAVLCGKPPFPGTRKFSRFFVI